jgi:hypothetical protein
MPDGLKGRIRAFKEWARCPRAEPSAVPPGLGLRNPDVPGMMESRKRIRYSLGWPLSGPHPLSPSPKNWGRGNSAEAPSVSGLFLTFHQCWDPGGEGARSQSGGGAERRGPGPGGRKIPAALRRKLPPVALFRIAGALLVTATPTWAQPAKSQNPNGPFLLLLLLPLAIVVFTALEIVLWVLAPAPLLATCRALERGRGRCLLTGLGVAAATLLLLTVLGQHPAVGKTAGPLLLGIVALGCLTGMTAVTSLLGRGALDLAGRTGSQALSVVVGSLLLGFVILFPIVGQVLGAYFLLVGLGGAIGALAESRREKK